MDEKVNSSQAQPEEMLSDEERRETIQELSEEENSTENNLAKLLELAAQKSPDSEIDQLLEKLTDRNLFNLLNSARNKWESASSQDGKGTLDNLRFIYGQASFIFGKRENYAYNKIASLKDEELTQKLYELPEEVKKLLVRIPISGKKYSNGSSMEWGLDGPRDKVQLVLDNLVFVRRSNLAPIKEDPQLVTPKSHLLPTLHWSLNSPVTSHMYGSWAESSSTIFAPAEGTIERNGPPLALNNVNSFWYDSDLVLPPGSVILQDKKAVSPLTVETSDYTLITTDFVDLESWLLIHRVIIEKMGYSFLGCGMWSDPRVNELLKSLKEKYAMRGGIEVDKESDRSFLETLKEEQEEIRLQIK